MSLSHALITVNPSTASIITTPASDEIQYAKSMTVSVQNLHTTHFVYLGSSTVSTSSYGFRIDPGQTWTSDLLPTEDLYAVTDTGTTQIAVIRIAR